MLFIHLTSGRENILNMLSSNISGRKLNFETEKLIGKIFVSIEREIFIHSNSDDLLNSHGTPLDEEK